MKKAMSIILCMGLMASLAVVVSPQVSGESRTNEIQGLREQMDTLWMINYFSPEELDDMKRHQENTYLDGFWSDPQYANRLMTYRGITYFVIPDDEQMYRLTPILPMKDGIKVTELIAAKFKYANTYAKDGNLEYLFSDKAYWFIGGGVSFALDGELIMTWNLSQSSLEEERDFLKNTDEIERMLYSVGVTKVYGVKVFDAAMLRCLYLHCDNGSYLIRLSRFWGDTAFSDFEQHRLYTVQKATQILADVSMTHKDTGDLLFGLDIAQNVATEKPAYAVEAEALRKAGLLNGNERGLDLYKPLTRIDAVTLLVRAIGLDAQATVAESMFEDIPDGSWGAKYANIAADQGITLGIGDNKFAPNDLVSDNQFATFLLRAVGAPAFDWETAIQILIDQGILTAEEAETMDFFTRGDMAKIIYEAMQKGLL